MTTPCKAALHFAIFPCLGLGDGLIAMVLSENLKKEGHYVQTFHPLLPQMDSLFPGHSLKPRPEEFAFLKEVDRIIIVYEKLDWMQRLMKEVLDQYPEKTTILNPIATPNRDYPYWEQGRFDGNHPFVENLINYLREQWEIKNPTKDNGICLPEECTIRTHDRRVILHPTSSRAGKNWTKRKFLQLARRLEKEGFEPIFLLTKKEAEDWPEINPPQFANLAEVAVYVGESGFMIGNDSGIGHLASCLGVPTLTICRSKLAANFWRPAWAKGEVIIPPRFIPNLKGMRWRDKKWQAFVPVSRVVKGFEKLVINA